MRSRFILFAVHCNLYFDKSQSLPVAVLGPGRWSVSPVLLHATRDDCGKITTFRGVAVFDARLRRLP